MQTRGSRKRKQEEEEEQPNKIRKVDTPEEDEELTESEKFEYFMALPSDLHSVIVQFCTVPVQIHFNEVCKAFRNSGSWVKTFILWKLNRADRPISAQNISRFTCLNYLDISQPTGSTIIDDIENDVNIMKTFQSLTTLISTRTSLIFCALNYLTNIECLDMRDRGSYHKIEHLEQLARMTKLNSLNISIPPTLTPALKCIHHLTQLKLDISFSHKEDQIHLLTNLKSLDLNCQKLNSSILFNTNLEKLILYADEYEHMSRLEQLKRLTRLEIGAGQNIRGLDSIGQMPQIRHLEIQYIADTERLLQNFTNLIGFGTRRFFGLPPNAEQLKEFSALSMDFTQDDFVSMAKLTNLETLKLNGVFQHLLADNIHALPTTIRNLTLEDPNGLFHIFNTLTNLRHLKTLTLSNLPDQEQGCDLEGDLKSFLLTMTQLEYLSVLNFTIPKFQREKRWFRWLQKNSITTTVEVDGFLSLVLED